MEAYGTVPLWSAWLEDEVGEKRARLAEAVSREGLETVLKRAGQHPRRDRIVGIYEGVERRETWGRELLLRTPAH
jgi:hypothetical protein